MEDRIGFSIQEFVCIDCKVSEYSNYYNPGVVRCPKCNNPMCAADMVETILEIREFIKSLE